MPELTLYRQPDFPAIYKWQAIAFMRMEWSSIFQGENLYMQETYPPEMEPIHFVAAERETLISYGSLLKVHLLHAGEEYHVYGFGNLMTFPPFRRQGYGGKILNRATRFIQESDMDAAILFCDPALRSFYAAQGWVPAHSPTRLGTPERYEDYAPLRMMLFASKKGDQGKADFENQPLYIDWPW